MITSRPTDSSHFTYDSCRVQTYYRYYCSLLLLPVAMSYSNDDFGGRYRRRRPNETLSQYYCNDPKRLCYAIAARNRRYAEQTMARLIELKSRRELTNKELEQWSKAERWIFDESEYYSRVEQLLVS